MASSKDDEAGVYALLMATSYVVPRALKASLRLGLFDIIAKKTTSSGSYVSAAEVATELTTKNPNAAFLLDRILYLLASYSLLDCSIKMRENGKFDRLYRPVPASSFLAYNDSGCSLGSLLLTSSPQENASEEWEDLATIILNGETPFFRAFGTSMYEFLNANPMYNSSFNKGMHDHSNIMISKILETYKGFDGCKSLVDVGGGTGASIQMIVTKYPQIQGVNFDLPHVIRSAEPFNGVTHIEGDMFVSIPNSDAILLKWVSHNWDDERFLGILKNCYAALPKNGKVIIIDCVMPLEPDSSNSTKYVAQMDVLMSLYLEGRERTQKEFETLFNISGFSNFQFVDCVYANWVIEINK